MERRHRTASRNDGMVPEFSLLERRLLMADSSFLSVVKLYNFDAIGSPIEHNYPGLTESLPSELKSNFQFTDDKGLHSYVVDQIGKTSGSDPGWVSGDVLDDVRAWSLIESTITNGGNHAAAAMSYVRLDYQVHMHSTATLPADFLKKVGKKGLDITIKLTASVAAKVEASDPANSTILMGSAGANFVVWRPGRTKNFSGLIVAALGDDFNIPYTDFEKFHYVPDKPTSDMIGLHLYSQTGLSWTMDEGHSGTISVFSDTDPVIEFDQAAFNTLAAKMKFAPFNLADYFAFDLSTFDPANTIVASKPDLVVSSDTGTSSTDDITGDVTPTFAGTVSAGPGQTPATMAVLYVDGLEAGRGAVVNGTYTITSNLLRVGQHLVTVAGGHSDADLGPESEALTVNIEPGLPAGSGLDVTLGVGGAKSIVLTDAYGVTATLKLTAGAAAIHLDGDNLATTLTSGKLVVTGESPQISQLALSGDTSKANLTFTMKKSGISSHTTIALGSITSTGAVSAIAGTGVDLLGDITIGGAIGALKLGSVPGAPHAISATSVGTFAVTGDLNGSTIHLAQGVDDTQPKLKALGSLTVGGAMRNTTIDSEGHIGIITVGKLIDSTIFAGVDTSANPLGTQPDEEADFDATARLDGLTIKGVKGDLPTAAEPLPIGFNHSFVAAWTLGTLTMQNLPMDGTATGAIVGCELSKSYSRKLFTRTILDIKGPQSGDELDPMVLDDSGDFVAQLI